MKKYSKWYILAIVFFLCLVIIPFTLSKYSTSVRNIITLNARQPEYDVIFVANDPNAVGTMAPQHFVYGTAQNLSANTFTTINSSFSNWNTEPDGSGTSYYDSQLVNNLTRYDNGTVTLYAIYDNYEYWHEGSYVFNGTNYVDTGISLFSDALINNNFEISFDIISRNTDTNKATLVSIMDEAGEPWPGIVYRIENGNLDQLGVNVDSPQQYENWYNRNDVQKFALKKYNDSLYININGTDDVFLADMSTFAQTFNNNVTFGASLDGNNNPFRYFTGTLSNMYVLSTNHGGAINFNSNGGTGTMASQIFISDKSTAIKKNTFLRSGYIFTGWNTESDGTGTSYTDEQVISMFAAEKREMTLYAQWEINNNPNFYVTFNSNGGTGTMADQYINQGVTQNLNQNTFTNGNKTFLKWNTAADGSGVDYADEASIVGQEPGNVLTLYAQWEPRYVVEFNANGGNGQMANQYIELGTSQNLATNTFVKDNSSFIRWNTSPDGLGTDYANGEEIIGQQPGQKLTLYALWGDKHDYGNEIVFRGNNYINTGIALFSAENINKDFEIAYEIKNYTYTGWAATLISAMDESNAPWPGIVFRVNSETNYEFIANVTNQLKSETQYAINSTLKVKIKRVNRIIYVSINDGVDQQFLDMSSLVNTFNAPLSIGASLDGNGNPQRYFTGTLSDISVILFDN